MCGMWRLIVGKSVLGLFGARNGHIWKVQSFQKKKKKPQPNLKILTGCVGLGNALIPKFKLMSDEMKTIRKEALVV